ncbi:MAG TPA: GlsB/YeaQ/YmgE family stress response membrane protein [Kofleriaceae bacterium]|nr:GlsB/YeaQ/YmgE family stress response membrane protein [Kofleriaceae bacterium]
MGIFIALAIGLIAGAIAKLLMPGRDPGGILVTMMLGVSGAIVAFLLGSAIGWYQRAGDRPGIIASVLGAMIVLAIYRFTARRS